jgi:glycyl-tRNA synthetase beta subunit
VDRRAALDKKVRADQNVLLAHEQPRITKDPYALRRNAKLTGEK